MLLLSRPLLECLVALTFIDESSFRNEGLPAIRVLEKRCANASAVAVDGLESTVESMISPSSPVPLGSALRVFRILGTDYKLFERRRNPKDQAASSSHEQRRVYCMNPKYSFIAQMDTDKEEYRTIQVFGPQAIKEFFNVQTEFATGFMPSWMLVDRSIAAWLETSGCRLLEVRSAATGSVTAKIEYASGQKTTQETQAPDFVAEVEFAPILGWAIKRVDMEVLIRLDGMVVKRRPIRYRINYGSVVDQMPIPEQVTFVRLDPDGKEKSEYVTKILEYRIGEARPSDFTLSAFGLPEPHGVTWPQPTPYWLYFGLAGFGFLALIIMITLVQRRLRVAKAA